MKIIERPLTTFSKSRLSSIFVFVQLDKKFLIILSQPTSGLEIVFAFGQLESKKSLITKKNRSPPGILLDIYSNMVFILIVHVCTFVYGTLYLTALNCLI